MKLPHLAFATLAGMALAAPQKLSKEETTSASRPFIGTDSLDSLCLPGRFENCVGTKTYCESKGWEREDEPKRYASKETCLADRVPPATSDPTTVKPDTAAKQCIVKFSVGSGDDEREISAPPIPCSEYRESLCLFDRAHDVEDSCGQCEKQCKGI